MFAVDPGVEITRLVSPSSLLDQSLVRLLNIDDLTPFYLLVVTQVCVCECVCCCSLDLRHEKTMMFKMLNVKAVFDAAIRVVLLPP